MLALELFAGCGGAALGIEAAGFSHAALVEINKAACATMRAAGHRPVVEADVRNLSRIDLAVRGRPIDLLWSSFPCQAWSIAGKRRGSKDRRNGWPWTVRALDRYKPRWLLAENVRGLVRHASEGCPDPRACPGCYFELVILRDLRERFEHVGWWVLNAADYGVPQRRRRVIVWAGPVPLPRPKPTHADRSALRQVGLFRSSLAPWVSMAEALGVPAHRCITWGSHKDGRPMEPVDGPAPTITTRFANTSPGGTAGGCALWDPFERLTEAQGATLQGFPAGYPWRGTTSEQRDQIGNAVPPKLAEVAARGIVEAERRNRQPSTGSAACPTHEIA